VLRMKIPTGFAGVGTAAIPGLAECQECGALVGDRHGASLHRMWHGRADPLLGFVDLYGAAGLQALLERLGAGGERSTGDSWMAEQLESADVDTWRDDGEEEGRDEREGGQGVGP
jgi:hypothetical protein